VARRAERPAISTALLRRGIRGVAVADFSGPTQLEPGVVGSSARALLCRRWWVAISGGSDGLVAGVPCGEWRWLGDGRTLRTSFADETLLELQV
jgi:hypothetical protein